MTSHFSGQTLSAVSRPQASSALKRSQVVTKPVKVLQNIYTKKISGDLTVKSLDDGDIACRLYFGQGELHYAASLLGGQERLRYALHHHLPRLLPQVPDSLKQSEYQWLCDRWQSGDLSFNELRSLLQYMTRDAFVQILSLPSVGLQFNRSMSLDTILLSMNLKNLVQASTPAIKEFRTLHPLVKSPLQRFKLLNDSTLSQATLYSLRQLNRDISLSKEILNRGLTLYELAVAFNVKILPLIRFLSPLIKVGNAELLPYQALQENQSPLIACIDDSATVQRTVKLILESVGYRVKNITEPLTALSSLGRETPSLILLDINMPDMDGYTLCRMLRQFTPLKDVPIVMLTGRDAMLDKVRARLLGASEYIVKPFEPQALTDMISQYVPLELIP